MNINNPANTSRPTVSSHRQVSLGAGFALWDLAIATGTPAG
jgi:hypothetical protein